MYLIYFSLCLSSSCMYTIHNIYLISSHSHNTYLTHIPYHYIYVSHLVICRISSHTHITLGDNYISYHISSHIISAHTRIILDDTHITYIQHIIIFIYRSLILTNSSFHIQNLNKALLFRFNLDLLGILTTLLLRCPIPLVVHTESPHS